ncbi:glycosyltransferase family 1 protein [Agromyces protaetiae]|uniref:Glycosyltransferase family 1 protein n=1 Tax=Agromyces protaetiae TaxID=2509455 RepID=A0A4P6FFE7_9MICO|nr:glycosyltransferase [Agromyces protaetiae]QAY74596.1 glycosyltransferase family 1 protein [Agromyces protaetiae]
MTITLRVIVDQIVAPVPGLIGRYTADLTRALIVTAPSGCEVEGVVSSSLPSDYETVQRELPGLAGLYKSSLARRDLAAAWQLGLTTSPGGGLIHAPSLFAPLRRHRREDGNQTVATVHDLLAWTHPEAMSTTSVAWQKAMLRRARKHADAVVVPTHALAEQVGMIEDFGDRIRVVPTAARSGLVIGPDAAERSLRLGLPTDYVVVMGTLEPRSGLVDVLSALARPEVPEVSLVVLGPESQGEQHLAAVAEESGVAPTRVHRHDDLDPADLAVVLAGARAYVQPDRDGGAVTAVIEAFQLGAPVIHTDLPAYAEIAAGAGIPVPVGANGEFVDRLAEAITRVLEDRSLADRLAIAGGDRSRAFGWRDSAERVWQLHADL